MDIHRSRFVPYPTSAITALAFSRSNDSGFTGPLPALKLALGRANGVIEIWNPQRGSWVQETAFTGEGRSVDGLLWTQESNDTDADGRIALGQYRLFSIASSPAVTEWDLTTGKPKRRSTGNFSEVWCFAAQPKLKQQKDSDAEASSQEIVAGCGDGTLVLLSTADHDLQFKRFLARVSGKKARCMCIAYQSRERVVAGFADSMIRIYDTRNGSQVRSMSLGVGIPGAPKNALVWQVRCLPNGDIVSGDSNGEVKFWDGKTYSQTQRISGHQTDCLDLTTSSDGRTVFSGSIDGKIAVYRQSNEGGRRSWAKISHRRTHSGEVKAMAAFDSKGLSVVVSGGSDVTPMITPLRAYGEENLRALPSLPQEPPVISAPKARLLASWWEKTVSIWRIARRSKSMGNGNHQRPRKLVAHITLDTEQDIQSVAITSDGHVLTVATNSETKVFQLRRRADSDSLAIRKVDVPSDLATSGARLLTFSPDGKWLVNVTPENEIFVVRLEQDPKRPKHIRVLDRTVELDRVDRKAPAQTGFNEYDRSITRATFSPDSSLLVVGDLSGYLDSWLLKGTEDATLKSIATAQDGPKDDASSDSDSDSSDDEDGKILFYGQSWVDNPSAQLLPKLESSPLVMMFRPKKKSSNAGLLTNGKRDSLSNEADDLNVSDYPKPEKYRLWIMTAKHQMYEFDILAGRLTTWSRKNPSASLPEDFSKIRDRVMGAVWDISSSRERIWLYGHSFVFMLNLGTNLDPARDVEATAKRRRKSKDGSGEMALHKRRKLESGAGGPRNAAHKGGVRGDVKRLEDGTSTTIDVNGANDVEVKEEDDDEEFGLQLTTLKPGGDELVATNDGVDDSQGERRWWCTFKYRPILGMVHLEDDAGADDEEPIEVVLVERPLWDSKRDGK